MTQARLLCAGLFAGLLLATSAVRAEAPRADASSCADGSSAAGALDGDRFATEPARSWQGRAGEKGWWWEVRFPRPRAVGAILQVVGDHALALRNAPKR